MTNRRAFEVVRQIGRGGVQAYSTAWYDDGGWRNVSVWIGGNGVDLQITMTGAEAIEFGQALIDAGRALPPGGR